MFENLGTALVQAAGFFAVFSFFVYQLLSDGKKPSNSQLPKKKVNEIIDSNNKSKKKGLFGRKKEPLKEVIKPQKKRLFGRKDEPLKEVEKTKKKRWFN